VLGGIRARGYHTRAYRRWCARELLDVIPLHWRPCFDTQIKRPATIDIGPDDRGLDAGVTSTPGSNLPAEVRANQLVLTLMVGENSMNRCGPGAANALT